MQPMQPLFTTMLKYIYRIVMLVTRIITVESRKMVRRAEKLA